MSFSISVEDNLKQVRKQLTRFERKQIPFATAAALTKTVADAKSALEVQLDKKLDRPTRFTRRAIAIVPASKRSLTAVVFIRPIQAEYLVYQVEGGVRRSSGSGIGVPTTNKRLNQYGNIAGRRSGLVKGKNQFIATIGGVTGVWQRTGGKRNQKLKLLIRFEKQVRYRPRYPFYKIASGVVRNRFPRHLQRSVSRAIATMR